MRVLVTGGTGFIGSNLVEALNRRDIVPVVLTRASSSLELLTGMRYEQAAGDILDPPDKLAGLMSGFDWVFHAAALSDYRWQDLSHIYETNVKGTRHMLSAAMSAGVHRFIFTSSLGALGFPKDGELLDESSQFNLPPERFPYGHSKHLAEVEVLKAVDQGLPAVILNPTAVIGPRSVNQTVGALIEQAAKGRLRLYPKGGLNIVSAGDVVAAHIAAAEKGRIGERYIIAGENLSYKKAISIGCRAAGQKPPVGPMPNWLLPPLAVLAEILNKIFGGSGPLDANQIRLAGRVIFADGSKAVNELGVPQTPFRDAVQDAIDWYVDHGYLSL